MTARYPPPPEERTVPQPEQAVLSRPVLISWPKRPGNKLGSRNWEGASTFFLEAFIQAATTRHGGRSGEVIGGVDIPPELDYLVGVIQESRKILTLGEDWDGEGSPGYSEQTWERAVRLLVNSALNFQKERANRVPAPAIHHGPEGGIDLYWSTPTRRLLVNVPADPGNVATYYGSDDRTEVKGRLDMPRTDLWLMVWLTQ